MAERRKREAHEYAPDEVLERGLVAVSDLIDQLAETPPENQDDRYHATNLTRCLEAVARVKAEHRAQIELEKKLGTTGDVRQQIIDYLRILPETERQMLWRACK